MKNKNIGKSYLEKIKQVLFKKTEKDFHQGQKTSLNQSCCFL